jgi:hypothetical protein
LRIIYNLQVYREYFFLKHQVNFLFVISKNKKQLKI